MEHCRKTSYIRRTLVGNKIVDHSDHRLSALLQLHLHSRHLASMDWAKTAERRDDKHLSDVIWCALYKKNWRYFPRWYHIYGTTCIFFTPTRNTHETHMNKIGKFRYVSVNLYIHTIYHKQIEDIALFINIIPNRMWHLDYSNFRTKSFKYFKVSFFEYPTYSHE